MALVDKTFWIVMLVHLVSYGGDVSHLQDPMLPEVRDTCIVPEINEAYDSSKAEYLEFANLHNDFLNETTHALYVIRILFTNYDKTLYSIKNNDVEQVNTHITLGELGSDVFDDPNVNTSDSNLSSREIGRMIKSHHLFSDSTEIGILFGDISDHVNMVTELAYEIDDYFSFMNMQLEKNQNAVATLLDETVVVFDCIAKMHIVLSQHFFMSNIYRDDKVVLEYYTSKWHALVGELSQALLYENSTEITTLIDKLRISLEEFSIDNYELNDHQMKVLKEAVELVSALILRVEKMNLEKDKDECNSKGYYCYNRIVPCINHIGPGYVGKLNEVLESRYGAILRCVALPIYFERVSC